MKIATWNVNSIRARADIVVNYLKENELDILAVQETKVEDESFPKIIFESLGYKVYFSGQKAYNGVAIASRLPLSNIKKEIIETNNEKRTIETDANDINIINSYFPHGGLRGEERFFFKLEFYKKMKNYLQGKIDKGFKLILLGDFNIAPEEIDVWNAELLKGTLGFMDEEREAFKDLLSIGLIDTFRQLNQNEKAFSWWDYRAGSFRKNEGMRIDHVVVSKNLLPYLKKCFIDKNPRKLKGTSDHTPVVLEIDKK
jgi:exodeoxyribonuclease-3